MSNENNNVKLDKTNMPDYGDYGLSTKYEDNHPVANPSERNENTFSDSNFDNEKDEHSNGSELKNIDKTDDIANESLVNQPEDNINDNFRE